jgi:hypothetical protein
VGEEILRGSDHIEHVLAAGRNRSETPRFSYRGSVGWRSGLSCLAQSAFTVAFPIKGDKSSVACWWEGERHTKLRSDLRLALGRVQAPLAGDAFELMRAAILEGEPGAGDEILDRA